VSITQSADACVNGSDAQLFSHSLMLANVPAVMIGGKLAARLPMQAIRLAAAGLFILTGVLTLLGWPA